MPSVESPPAMRHSDGYISQSGSTNPEQGPSYHITAMENIISVAFSPFDSILSCTHSLVVLAAISSFLILAGTFYTLRESGSKSQIPALGGLSIVNGWNFFVRRCDFLLSNFQKTGHPIFSFKVLQVSLASSLEFVILLLTPALAPSSCDGWRRCS